MKGKFEIKISKDKMQATLTQKEHIDDIENLTFEALLQLVKEHGISYGIKEDVLKEIVQFKGLALNKTVVIAEGMPPVDGENAYLKPIDFTAKKKDDKQEDKKRINFRNVKEIPNVHKGEVLGIKVEATKGTPGINVLGENVPAKPGRDIKLRKGKNTVVTPDGTKILADIDGQVSFDGKTIHVYPVYEVSGDLDMKTGNIDFVGNVVIRGNVPNGFEIKAKGDIHVYGTVESAFLYSEGSIFVNAGIVGQGNGKIYAKNNLHTTFINQGNIEVENDVHVSQSILHSTVIAGGSIYCEQGKGNIVGGHISAGKCIYVNECGNMMHTPTHFYIGENQKLIERKNQLESERDKLKEELEKLMKLNNAYARKEESGQSLTPKERVMRLRIKSTLLEVQERFQEAVAELEELSHQTEKNAGFLQVKNHLYENTTITFGKYSRKITKHYQYVKVLFDNGEIKIVNL